MEFFKNKSEPTINELVYWFQVEFTKLADEMKASNHNVIGDEPNPYHIEDTIWTHTMMVCQRAEIFEVQKVNKICALLHDIGKPTAREVIPFEAKKPVHSESNELRNNGKNNGKPSGMNRNLKYHKEQLDFSEEELIKRFPEEYKRYLEEINQ